MDLIVEDQTMWLVDIQVQFVLNLEEAQRRYKENVDQHRKEQPSSNVKDQVWL
jgi:hypothetical protein